jgi:uncharacterized protein YbcC (UPF0753/DUF2309 family)
MSDTYTDVQRMELRSHVNLAGEAVAKLWPMRTFISRNPLQGFEHLPFEEAVRRGEDLYGARGYMPLAWFRAEWRSGRITTEALSQALADVATGSQVQFGNQRLSHLQILHTAMIHDLGSSAESNSGHPAQSGRAPEDIQDVDRYLAWAEVVLPARLRDSREEPSETAIDGWPSRETSSEWCDRTIGTTLREQINRELIKWLVPFCDEGEATWAMPYRERTFFRTWKTLAPYDRTLRMIGIAEAAGKIRALPDRPEDALLQSLEMLGIPVTAWQDYLARHLTALPGWAGFIKWRSSQPSHPWQEAYRIDLVKYLAVRLFYERELVVTACRKVLRRDGHADALSDYARTYPHAYWFRRSLLQQTLPPPAVREASRLRGWWRPADDRQWEEAGARWYDTMRREAGRRRIARHVGTLLRLAETLRMEPALLLQTPPGDLATLLDWIEGFSPSAQQAAWLEAYELTHIRQIVGTLSRKTEGSLTGDNSSVRTGVRPFAQFAFCIDVRSEVFRRHLEQRGGYETFGFAGFFGLPVSFRPLDEPHEAELCPVLLRPKHVVREVPRTYDARTAQRRRLTQHAAKSGRELLHDLKHNVITPYVMVEAVGWFFGWPLIGKTLFPKWYDRIAAWLAARVFPKVATTLTVDKLTTAEAEEMVAVDQRRRILEWLRSRRQVEGTALTPERLEAIRLQALGEHHESAVTPGELGHLLVLTKAHETRLLDELRQACRINPRETTARIDQMVRTGFTTTEQAYYVETALRLMGLTTTFARLVFLCGHESHSQNNPYESSLDCGACGGSGGLPNARTFATIANRTGVRELLAQRGIIIPSDTQFVAAVHDTTTDRLTIADLEDVPSTHRRELAQVMDDLAGASADSAAERHGRLEGRTTVASASGDAIRRRSHDWAQVRPEWGLARNSLFIIGGRRLTYGTDLEGRSFLHSYDYRIDPDGKLLEVIMTAPLIVAEWINLEYYFSTVAPEMFGSGSKVYHNVTGRIGVMSGNMSDLRMGLPRQSLLNGHRPYHEPMRLTAVIEAPRTVVDTIVQRQPLLKQLFTHRWIKLVVLDPVDRASYRMNGGEGWGRMAGALTEMCTEIHTIEA